MKKFSQILVFCTLSIFAFTGCARDLSNSTYVENSTFSLTFEGVVKSARPITVKANDKMSKNTTGMAVGGVAGGAVGSRMGRGSGNTASIIGGAIVGGIIGAAVEGALSKSEGVEYIIAIDTSKTKDELPLDDASPRLVDAIAIARTSGIVTVVQSKENFIPVGSKVFVIMSEDRTRVVRAD